MFHNRLSIHNIFINYIMNYVISSLILLSVVCIIIYILSIDNNMDKAKNKFKHLTKMFKKPELTNNINEHYSNEHYSNEHYSNEHYLNQTDSLNLLNYIKSEFFKLGHNYNNITIPNKIYHKKTNKGYELNDINLICYKLNNSSLNNVFKEVSCSINVLFVPFEKDNYYSNHMLFGRYGNYIMTIKGCEPEKKVTFAEDDSIINTEILDMIPDVINLSEEDTTDTERLINSVIANK